MGKYIPVEPEKWAEMVKAMADNRLLKAEVERLTSEVSYDNRVQLHVDKLAGEFTQAEVERLKAEVERLEKLKAELKVGVTSEGEKPDQSDKDFKITIGFNSMEEFDRDVASARELIPEIIALANLSKGGQK
jgi:hypothetical protein